MTDDEYTNHIAGTITILVLVACLLAGCGPSAPVTKDATAATNAGRTVSGAIYNVPLVAVDDTARGVTCYSQGSQTLSCVRTAPSRLRASQPEDGQP